MKHIEPREPRTSGEPSNADRASWAGEALSVFARRTSSEDELDAAPDTMVTDLLCNLMHWCKYNNIDFVDALHSAIFTHYHAEATPAAIRLFDTRLARFAHYVLGVEGEYTRIIKNKRKGATPQPKKILGATGAKLSDSGTCPVCFREYGNDGISSFCTSDDCPSNPDYKVGA